MAQIFPESQVDTYGQWMGQIQWPEHTNDNLIEPNASGVQNELKRKGYEVEYYHAPRDGPARKTNYTLKSLAEVEYPERPMEDWEKAVRGVSGAKSIYFQGDGEVNTN